MGVEIEQLAGGGEGEVDLTNDSQFIKVSFKSVLKAVAGEAAVAVLPRSTPPALLAQTLPHAPASGLGLG